MKNELEDIPGLKKVDWDSPEENVQDAPAPDVTPDAPAPDAPAPDAPAPDAPAPDAPPQGDAIVDDVKFDIEFFNKSFGTKFDTEDALKNALQDSSKAKDLESKLLEYESLKSDIEYYKNGYNPLDLFASEDDFRVQQFKKQNPDKDASVAHKAFTSDLSKQDDLDVLVMYEMLNNPGLKGGEAGAREIVADQYGVDMEDRDSWTTLVQNKLKKAANLARSEIKGMKDGIELPKVVDLKSQREADIAAQNAHKEELKTKWSATVDNMFNHMDKVPIYEKDADGKDVELLNYVMDDKSKSALKQEVYEYVVNSGKDLTEDNINEAGQLVYSRFVLNNVAKIVKSYANDLLAKQEKKVDTEIHNAEKVTTDTKPASDLEKEKAEFINFALGNDKGFKRKPLF